MNYLRSRVNSISGAVKIHIVNSGANFECINNLYHNKMGFCHRKRGRVTLLGINDQ